MRPPRVRHSLLRYPLDEVLGTTALVRLLRVLVYEVGGPVGVTDAASMAGLSPSGARKGLEALERLGVVARIGTGRALKFGPRPDDPYLAMLRQLFEEEQRQFGSLMHALRQTVAMPEAEGAWVRGLDGGPSAPLELDVVVDATAVSWIGSELRTRLMETEKRFDLIIEVNVFTRADDASAPKDAIVLWGPADDAFGTSSPGAQSHAESAERSLRLAQVIADMIKSDPSLIQRALRHTERLLHEGQGTAEADIGEWRQLLETYSPERVRDLLVSESSRAQRLRRSSPFFAVLTPDERDRMMRAMEAQR